MTTNQSTRRHRWVLPIAVAAVALLAAPIAQGRATVKNLHDPSILDRPLGVERLLNGHTLITDGGGAFYTATDASVMEVDASGKIVWQYVGDLVFPHSAERLADGSTALAAGGSTLISDTSNDRVFRVDAAGKIVWNSDDWGNGRGLLSDGSHLRYPNNAKRLANGHLLITDRNNDRVVEVDDAGTVVWTLTGLNRPHNASRLPDGHTIVSDSDNDTVLEVDANGQRVWQYGGKGMLDWPRDVDRLDNGNTLITDSRNNRVIELTPGGQVVWQFGGLSLPYEADRLPDGHTLIADNGHKRVIEVDAAGTIVWSFRNFPEEYPATVQNGGFEDVDAAGQPVGWYAADLNAERGEFTFAVDDMASHGGQRSGFLSYRGTGRITWLQVAQAKPQQDYVFSGYLRATTGKDGVAVYQLWFLDDMGGPIGEPITLDPHTSTVDWVHDQKEVRSPAGTAAVQIWCNLWSNGRAWFDDVSLVEAEKGTGGFALDLPTLLLMAGVAGFVLLVLLGMVWFRSRRR